MVAGWSRRRREAGAAGAHCSPHAAKHGEAAAAADARRADGRLDRRKVPAHDDAGGGAEAEVQPHLGGPQEADRRVHKVQLQLAVEVHDATDGRARAREQQRDVDVVPKQEREARDQQQRQQHDERRLARGRVGRLRQDAARLQQPLQQPTPQRDRHGQREEEDEDREADRHVGVDRHLERALQRGHVLGERGGAKVVRAQQQREREREQRADCAPDGHGRQPTMPAQRPHGAQPARRQHGGGGARGERPPERLVDAREHRQERRVVNVARDQRVQARGRGDALAPHGRRRVRGGGNADPSRRFAVDIAAVVPAHVVPRERRARVDADGRVPLAVDEARKVDIWQPLQVD